MKIVQHRGREVGPRFVSHMPNMCILYILSYKNELLPNICVSICCRMSGAPVVSECVLWSPSEYRERHAEAQGEVRALRVWHQLCNTDDPNNSTTHVSSNVKNTWALLYSAHMSGWVYYLTPFGLQRILSVHNLHALRTIHVFTPTLLSGQLHSLDDTNTNQKPVEPPYHQTTLLYIFGYFWCVCVLVLERVLFT